MRAKAALGWNPVTSPPPALAVRLGRCWCKAMIPPGRPCCWLHSGRFEGDDEPTPVAPSGRAL